MNEWIAWINKYGLNEWMNNLFKTETTSYKVYPPRRK